MWLYREPNTRSSASTLRQKPEKQAAKWRRCARGSDASRMGIMALVLVVGLIGSDLVGVLERLKDR